VPTCLPNFHDSVEDVFDGSRVERTNGWRWCEFLAELLHGTEIGAAHAAQVLGDQECWPEFSNSVYVEGVERPTCANGQIDRVRYFGWTCRRNAGTADNRKSSKLAGEPIFMASSDKQIAGANGVHDFGGGWCERNNSHWVEIVGQSTMDGGAILRYCCRQRALP
jgi:hypothetical protein